MCEILYWRTFDVPLQPYRKKYLRSRTSVLRSWERWRFKSIQPGENTPKQVVGLAPCSLSPLELNMGGWSYIRNADCDVIWLKIVCTVYSSKSLWVLICMYCPLQLWLCGSLRERQWGNRMRWKTLNTGWEKEQRRKSWINNWERPRRTKTYCR